MLKILEKGRILVVADASKNQKTVVKALEHDGFDVSVAETAEQAMFQLYDEVVDLIAIDLKMRSSEGIRTFDKLMAHDEWRQIPKIVLSEDPEIIKYLDGFDTSNVESISEPIKPLILNHRVEALISQKTVKDQLGKCMGKTKSHEQVISEAETIIKSQQTKIDKLDEEISNIVIKDSLTDLSNQKFSIQRLKEEVARYDRSGNIFSLILCDIDNLQAVNVKYGREAGDAIIKKAAELITDGKRQQDFAARWNGGEFMLLLPDTDLEGAQIFAERARERVEKHRFSADEIQFSITMTFGVNCYDKVMTPDKFVTLADRALQRGKHEGRNRVILADSL